MLTAMRETNQIHGLTLCEGLRPQSHQQFVDDMMLMGPASVAEAWGIKLGLNTFLEASGLEVNNKKS